MCQASRLRNRASADSTMSPSRPVGFLRHRGDLVNQPIVDIEFQNVPAQQHAETAGIALRHAHRMGVASGEIEEAHLPAVVGD